MITGTKKFIGGLHTKESDPTNATFVETRTIIASGTASSMIYYPIAKFNSYDLGKPESLLLQGVVGGWTKATQAHISLLIPNGSPPLAMTLFKLQGDGSSNVSSAPLNLVNIIGCYSPSDKTSTIYAACGGNYAFTLDVTYTGPLVKEGAFNIVFNGVSQTSIGSGEVNLSSASSTTMALHVASAAAYVGSDGQTSSSLNKLMTKSEVTSLINSLTTSSY